MSRDLSDWAFVGFWCALLVSNVITASKNIGYPSAILIALMFAAAARFALEALTARLGSRLWAVRALQLAVILPAFALLFIDGLPQTLIAIAVDVASLVFVLGKDDDFDNWIKRTWKAATEKARAFSRPVMGDLKPS